MFTKRGGYIIKCVVTSLVLISIILNDLHNYKVNNKLILIGTIAGLVFSIYSRGIYGVGDFILGYMSPMLLLFLFFLLKMFGAGDIKTYAVIGGLYGISFVLQCIVYSIIVGGGLSILVILKSKNLTSRLNSIIGYVSSYIYTKKVVAYDMEEAKEQKAVIHFTVAILAGFLLAYFYPLW